MHKYTVSQAARILGVSQQAIYARIKRDTIKHEIAGDDMIYVYLHDEELETRHADNGAANAVVNDYITSLKSEIESLKADRELWQEEARRKDTIIAQMNQTLQSTINRLPELEAPQDTPPRATESSVTDRNEESRGDVPPEPQNESWWRRIFR